MVTSLLPDGGDIVDSHCHCGDIWYEPVEVLLFQMDRVGVARAVLIEYFGQYDNRYQTSVQQQYPDRFASVVLIDPDSPTAIAEMDKAVADGARGFRFRMRYGRPFGYEAEPGNASREPNEDHLALMAAGEERGLVLSLMGTLPDFGSEEFFDVVAAFPNLRFAIEHGGSSNHPNRHGDVADTRERIFELGKFENVYIKMGGLAEFYERLPVMPGGEPLVRPETNFHRRAYGSYGPRRIIWGSDYPPSSVHEGYENALRWPLQEYSWLPSEEQAMIFGGNSDELFFS